MIKYLKKLKKSFYMCREIYGKENDKKFIFVVVFNILTILLEILSIALILPVIDLILNDGKLSLFKLNISAKELNIHILLFCIIILFTLKTIFLIYINRYQLKIAFNLSKDLSNKLFKKYLNKDYIFFTQSNSSILLRDIFNECKIFSMSVVLSAIKLLSDFLIIIFFITFLLQFNFKITIIFIIFFSLLAIIYLLFVKDKLLKLGKDRSLSESNRIKFIQEGFRSFQLIKSFNLKKFFLEKYKIQNEISHNVYYQDRFYSFLPKVLFELSIVVFLISIIYIFINFFTNKNDIIIQLSAFGLVCLRLMPVMNNMIYGIQLLRFHENVINHLYEILNKKNETNKIFEIKKSLKENFSLKNIFYKYPGTKQYVLNDLNFSFQKGDTISISGSSGSGKSTLLNIIMGILRIEAGTILIDDKKINKGDLFNIENLGFVPQNTFLLDDSIINNIILNRPYNENEFIDALKLAGLLDFYDDILDKNIPLGEGGIKVSGGQKQRIALARALYRKSETIILDEPTSSLDLETKSKIYKFLKEINQKNNCTIIIVSHDDIPTGITEHNYCLKNGKLSKLINI